MAGPARSGREARGSSPRSSGRLTTVRLTVEYDGSEFHGFQWQPVLRTVAGVLEAALSRLLAEPVKIDAAGRTDAGVHACGQVVSFTTGREFPFERLCIALNSELPRDLAVSAVAAVAPPFSARFSALERTYVYAIFNRPQPAPLLARLAYHVWAPIDLTAMRAALPELIGEHDFRSFCGMAPKDGLTIRTVRRLDVEARGDLIRIEIAAGGFLHRMVRTIVGTLVECGTRRREPDDIANILAARRRGAAGHSAPPNGLYLAGVRYDDYDSYAEPPIFRWANVVAASG